MTRKEITLINKSEIRKSTPNTISTLVQIRDVVLICVYVILNPTRPKRPAGQQGILELTVLKIIVIICAPARAPK